MFYVCSWVQHENLKKVEGRIVRNIVNITKKKKNEDNSSNTIKGKKV